MWGVAISLGDMGARAHCVISLMPIPRNTDGLRRGGHGVSVLYPPMILII